MDDAFSFEAVCGNGSGQLDLVFVHGLTGHPKDTWSTNNGKAQVFWPSWFCDDFPDVSVFTLGYPASVFGKWAKKEMTLYERAENALESLTSNNVGTKPLAFVAHSLGGLLAKQILRTAIESSDEDWNLLATNTKLVAFLATPHSGAALAALLKTYAKPFTSTHITALSNDCGQLDDLNNAYRDFAPKASIKTIAYYEKFKTHNVMLVDHGSSNPGISGTRAIALDADHINICKPKDRDALVYQSLRRHLKKVVPKGKVKDAFGIPDYGSPDETDRRDLLQKLIDAGREYQYHSARDHQNAFAQRYYKLGLHTDAKLLHDEVLSEIEQRFTLHVYQGAICKQASDQEIAKAVQINVIDPVCSRYKSSGVSPTDVLRAIYFLTQQCHIKWDAL